MTSQLHIELWTSWASLLRSYAAAHGMSAKEHAVIEISADAIMLRVGTRWTRFTHDNVQRSDDQQLSFTLNEEGTVSIADAPAEEMDMAAERFAREMLHP
jgi:hypothetical protein